MFLVSVLTVGAILPYMLLLVFYPSKMSISQNTNLVLFAIFQVLFSDINAYEVN